MSKNPQIFILSIAIFFLSFNASGAEISTWVKKSQSVKGEWSIESRDGSDYLVFSDDFNTRNGPDLKLMLSNLSITDVNNDNADESSIIIAPLESNKGAQEYRLPEGYAEYSTLLIHCEKFSKLWAASDLKLNQIGTD